MPTAKKAASATKSAAKASAAKAAAKPAAPAKAVAPKKQQTRISSEPSARAVPGDKYLAKQQASLIAARADRLAEADALKAEADQLALDAEPGDTQFDDESGEGSTTAVDRERDLALSAQARAEVMEIDVALDKIDTGSYGTCERCNKPIPKARLEVIPWAALCVNCKSGGLSARR
jgi:DnaK suppressor protein